VSVCHGTIPSIVSKKFSRQLARPVFRIAKGHLLLHFLNLSLFHDLISVALAAGNNNWP
jgi:hypothetical protein